jgi:hypothetical protein
MASGRPQDQSLTWPIGQVRLGRRIRVLRGRSRQTEARSVLLASRRRPSVDRNRADLHDAKVDVKITLCALWISTLFVFAYVDLFGFFRADVINGVLAGKVSGTGIEINQIFLIFTTIFIVIPSLMVIVSLLAPARINRTTNIVVSLIYLVSAGVTIVGETWVYYILGMVVQMMLLLAIARVAWTWPRRPAHRQQLAAASRAP